jgi:hypothetical protein
VLPFSFFSKGSISLQSILADQITCSSYSIKFIAVEGLYSLIIDSMTITKSTRIYFSFMKCSIILITNAVFSSTINDVTSTSAMFDVSNTEAFTFANSSVQSLRLGMNMFSFLQVKQAKFFNLTHSSLILRRYVLWVGGTQLFGNISISELNFTIVQGIPASGTFIPGPCMILDIDTYHTMEMKKVTLTDSQYIILFYSFSGSVSTLFEGLLFERIKYQNYYFIMAYMTVTAPENNTLVLRDSKFSEMSWVRDIFQIYVSKWTYSYFNNLTILDTSFNTSIVKSNDSKVILWI